MSASLWGGPLLAAVVGGTLRGATDLGGDACWTAAITVWCAVWWVMQPVSLSATSLIPFAALPLTGVLDHKAVATAYGHHLVLLMLAGSIVARAMEKSGAHRHVALSIVGAVGGSSPRRVVLGFVIVAAVLSMWMSNTATTVMLLPVAIAVVDAGDDPAIAPAVLLAVCYGASIGGSATPIGTPPNLILLAHLPPSAGPPPTFVQWMGYGLPVVAVMVPAAWWWLCRALPRRGALPLPKAGRWTTAQRRVLAVFAVTAAAWMTRTDPWGGWSGALGVADTVGDSTVAIAAAVALFVLPGGEGRGRLLDWATAKTIPWGVFIMIGGGIALGRAFEASHLGAQIGVALAPFAARSLWLVVPVLCLAATFVTEVTSNTAAANVLMPILAATAVAAGVDAAWLMLPACLSLNHAFMLPVATAPNAIVFGTGRVSTGRMAREGLVLNLIGVVAISVVVAIRLGG